MHEHSHVPEAQPRTAPASWSRGALSRWVSALLTSPHLMLLTLWFHPDTQFSLSLENQLFSNFWVLRELFSLPGTSFLLSLPFGTLFGWNSHSEAMADHLQWQGSLVILMAPSTFPSTHSHSVSMYLLHDYGYNARLHQDAVSLKDHAYSVHHCIPLYLGGVIHICWIYE